MRTVGQILKSARQERKISLEEVAAATRIHPNYLQALEKNDFQKLPSITSARGFIKNYAEFLGLKGQPILAIFRRDFGKKEKAAIVLPGLVKPVGKSKFSWSPKLNLLSLLVVLFLFLIAYLTRQYFSLMGRPALTVFSPQDKQEIFQKEIEVSGKADPDTSVMVNEQLIFLSSQGEFHYQLELFPGENKIIIKAKSKLGKETQIERTVFRLDK